MKQPLYAVYGASGCGRGIMPLAREQLHHNGGNIDRLIFVDDNPPSETINGHRVLSYVEFMALEASERFIAIAVAGSEIRETLAGKCFRDGIKPWTIKASNVVIMDNVQIGEGSILSPFVTLTSNIKIGKYFHANLYSYVEHDCVVGDFVTFGPGVKCNGNIVIEDHAYICSGVVIKQGTPNQPLVIGKNAIVGMGSVVTKDVPRGATVVGNPAREIVKTG